MLRQLLDFWSGFPEVFSRWWYVRSDVVGCVPFLYRFHMTSWHGGAVFSRNEGENAET